LVQAIAKTHGRLSAKLFIIRSMDSLTQIVLGASVAAAVVPAHHRRAALLAGAVLGTLPDLDSFPIALLTDDPVALMTMHRGLSHSLLVLPLVGWLIWAFFRRRGGRVSEAPWPWFWAIQLALVTHPILDAFTVYGTQLLWPLPFQPVMWSSVFIIDLGYTLWLLIGVIVAAVAATRPLARHALLAGLLLSTAYIGWSLAAKLIVERAASQTLAEMGLEDAPRFSVPMPLNTLLWRVVVMTPEGYLEGFRSVVADSGPMRFSAYESDVAALEAVADFAAVRRLNWFNHGFMRAERRDDELVLSDLRMGTEPGYSFNFVVAEDVGDQWRAVEPPRQLPWEIQIGEGLPRLWARIWDEDARLTAP
jgi:inner membrane protein